MRDVGGSEDQILGTESVIESRIVLITDLLGRSVIFDVLDIGDAVETSAGRTRSRING